MLKKVKTCYELHESWLWVGQTTFLRKQKWKLEPEHQKFHCVKKVEKTFFTRSNQTCHLPPPFVAFEVVSTLTQTKYLVRVNWTFVCYLLCHVFLKIKTFLRYYTRVDWCTDKVYILMVSRNSFVEVLFCHIFLVDLTLTHTYSVHIHGFLIKVFCRTLVQAKLEHQIFFSSPSMSNFFSSFYHLRLRQKKEKKKLFQSFSRVQGASMFFYYFHVKRKLSFFLSVTLSTLCRGKTFARETCFCQICSHPVP